jgi:hypothetical protein
MILSQLLRTSYICLSITVERSGALAGSSGCRCDIIYKPVSRFLSVRPVITPKDMLAGACYTTLCRTVWFARHSKLLSKASSWSP